MTKLVETIAKSLVGYPEKVEVTQKEGTDGSVLQLHVADEDMGRVIGKQGKIAKALKTINITKKEWVLNGATVLYGSATELQATLNYDLSEERKFSYKNLSMSEVIHHLAIFISRLWQIHVFSEGNTSTAA